MFIGGTNPYGLGYLADLIIDEQLSAPDTAISRVTLTQFSDGFVAIEFLGRTACVQPEDFEGARPSENGWPPFFSLVTASALSAHLEVEVVRLGRRWTGAFGAGVAAGSMRQDAVDMPDALRLRYRADPILFNDSRIAFFSLCPRVQEWAMFHPGTFCRFEDQTGPQQRRDYHYPDGLSSYMQEIEGCGSRWRMRLTEGACSAEAVVCHGLQAPNLIYSFVNRKRTRRGGSHERGWKQALAELLRRDRKNPDRYLGHGARGTFGWTVVLAVTLSKPEWEGATQDRLTGDGPRGLVHRMVVEQLPALMERDFS